MAKYRNKTKAAETLSENDHSITLEKLLSLTKALSDDNRIRAAAALQAGELCVCQIIELLGLAPSTVSKHMSILKQSGIVTSRKSGKWVYYSLSEKSTSDNIADIVTLALKKLKNDVIIKEDAAKLRKIKTMDPDQICRL